MVIKTRYSLIFALMLLSSHSDGEVLTHKGVAQKKTSYLSHFKHLSGSVDIEDGVLQIHKNIRLQANKAYVENVPDLGLRLVAHGNVMINYYTTTLVCDYLEYYEDTDTCLLTNGRFAVFPWFIGGSMITLTPETLAIHKGYISTSEGPNKHIQLSGKSIEYSADGVLSIDGTVLTICNTPVFLLPKISIIPTEIPKPPINFRGGSGGFLGSYLGISYAPIAKKHCHTTLFLDSFFKHGIGLGCDVKFTQKTHPENVLNIQSYYAHHLPIDMAEAKDRYRLNGDFTLTHSKTKVFGEYHLSDSWETVADVFPNNFSLKNTGPTNVNLFWQDHWFRGLVTSSVKVNNFQSVNQQLPYIQLRQTPIKLQKSGIIFEHAVEGGFLDYSFSKYISQQHFSSLRTSVLSNVYRPFPLYIGTFTPSVSGTAIYYNQLPSGARKHTQASLQTKLDYRFTAYKAYSHFKHIVEPFIQFTTNTRPLVQNQDHYIFSIADAYHSLHIVQIGVDTCLMSKISHEPKISATCCNTYLINNKNTCDVFPKTAMKIRIPIHRTTSIYCDTEWIWKQCCWDHFNILWQWIGNKDLALNLEFLHRSKYNIIKSDRDNYILDISRPLDEILNTPLSDRRNTLLGKIFARPHPCWNYQLSLRYGWHREHSPQYLEYQIMVGTKVFEHWQLYSVYEKREADNRFFFYLKLDKPQNPNQQKSA